MLFVHSLRVQALLYLRMFKMYNREVKEYYKVVQEYQQKVDTCNDVWYINRDEEPNSPVQYSMATAFKWQLY